MANELSNETTLEWVQAPPRSLDAWKPHGWTAEAALLVFVAVSASPVGKKLQELIAEDSWKAVKRLVCAIWKRQNQVAYRLASLPYIMLEMPQYTLALGLTEISAEKDDKGFALDDVAALQDTAFRWYVQHWGDVLAETERRLAVPFDFERVETRPVVAVYRWSGSRFHVEVLDDFGSLHRAAPQRSRRWSS